MQNNGNPLVVEAMKIRIFCIGKIKENFLKEGIAEYLKRLSPYAKIEIVEVSDEPIKENPNKSDIDNAINKEGKKILKLLKNTDYLISLDLDQKEFKSESFAEFLMKNVEISGSNLSFVIGGSYGLSDELKNRANNSFSLSQMTFTHQMTRLILLEQIYRAFKILNNEVYHK